MRDALDCCSLGAKIIMYGCIGEAASRCQAQKLPVACVQSVTVHPMCGRRNCGV